MITPLPDLSLKIERKKSITTNNTNSNTSTNTNTNSQTVIFNTLHSDKDREIITIVEPKTDDELSSTTASDKIESSNTPDNIKIFKEFLLATLISYFKSEIILANNIIEISPNIVLKVEDLRKLIAILICDSDENRVNITTTPLGLSGCKFLSCCAKLPLYCKIDEIIIDKKYGFKNYYNTYFNQINNNLNISLDYVLN
jgi:hypothetical protein